MNIKKKKIKNKWGMGVGALLVMGCGLGACAYDPIEATRGQEKSSEMNVEDSKNPHESEGVDILISERVVMKNYPEKIRRLTILEDAVLATNGQPLKLEVEEIVSFNGRIDTTPFAPSPSTASNGISGQLFHLSAKRGHGNLEIIAGGQDGGTGAKGAPGKVGAKGAGGRSGKNKFRIKCFSSKLRIFNPGLLQPCFKEWYCSQQTGDGARGGSGGTGKTGLPGGRGGNSAPVLVELEDPTDLIISTDVRVGNGGNGGIGGDGGPGGIGGNPGSRDSRKLCRVGKRGPRGSNGAQGLKGPNGKAGIEQPICLRLGTAQIGDCRDFNNMTQ